MILSTLFYLWGFTQHTHTIYLIRVQSHTHEFNHNIAFCVMSKNFLNIDIYFFLPPPTGRLGVHSWPWRSWPAPAVVPGRSLGQGTMKGQLGWATFHLPPATPHQGVKSPPRAVWRRKCSGYSTYNNICMRLWEIIIIIISHIYITF